MMQRRAVMSARTKLVNQSTFVALDKREGIVSRRKTSGVGSWPKYKDVLNCW
jgi:hypothetical protein